MQDGAFARCVLQSMVASDSGSSHPWGCTAWASPIHRTDPAMEPLENGRVWACLWTSLLSSAMAGSVSTCPYDTQVTAKKKNREREKEIGQNRFRSLGVLSQVQLGATEGGGPSVPLSLALSPALHRPRPFFSSANRWILWMEANGSHIQFLYGHSRGLFSHGLAITPGTGHTVWGIMEAPPTQKDLNHWPACLLPIRSTDPAIAPLRKGVHQHAQTLLLFPGHKLRVKWIKTYVQVS